MNKRADRENLVQKSGSETPPQNTGNNLKRARKSLGLSQQGLSDASGVKKRLIQAYEQGEREINHSQLETLCDLCAVLNCKIEEILDDEDLIEKYRKVK